MSNGEVSGQASGNGQGNRALSGDSALSGDTYTARRLVSLFTSLDWQSLSNILYVATLLPRASPQHIPAFLHWPDPRRLAR